MGSSTEEQKEELEALKSIFDIDLTEVTSVPVCIMIKLSNLEVEMPGPVSLKITFTASYPDEIPVIEMPMRSGVLTTGQCRQLVKHLTDVAKENVGMAMCFILVDEAKQWICGNIQAITGQEESREQVGDNIQAVTGQEESCNIQAVTGQEESREQVVIIYRQQQAKRSPVIYRLQQAKRRSREQVGDNMQAATGQEESCNIQAATGQEESCEQVGDNIQAVTGQEESCEQVGDNIQAVTGQEECREQVGDNIQAVTGQESREQVGDNIQAATGQEESREQTEEADSTLDPSTVKCPEIEIPVSGGRWDFVIGIVGKPSAGKSTFFNAAATRDLAKMAAHPFTTIEPNISKAYYSIPCPCRYWQRKCDADYGHNYSGDRFIPVLLKDVAGLVPGAYQGKGRGNRFLNDLLDADVLIHVVDISGTTNERGEVTADYDPSIDVTWLQNEIHQWIFDNIWSKWDAIKRRPYRLLDMFTGYHANRGLIHTVLRNCDITDRELLNLPQWEEKILHKIVDEFLTVRFPTLLVLNKCDMPNAKENIERLQLKFPNATSIPTSAMTEFQLQQLERRKSIQYDYGAASFSVSDNGQLSHGEVDVLHKADQFLLEFGTTNIRSALCSAVKLKSPSHAFPVQCVEQLRSLNRPQSHENPGQLRDCVSLRPGSTAGDLHRVLQYYQPHPLLSGDYVRAETLDQEGKRRPVKKDEVIDSTNSIIRIMTSKKSNS